MIACPKRWKPQAKLDHTARFRQEPTMTKISLPRVLDHLVLPVIDIDVARSRYQSLGFTVAPDGRHPFGTENCCVFFEDS